MTSYEHTLTKKRIHYYETEGGFVSLHCNSSHPTNGGEKKNNNRKESYSTTNCGSLSLISQRTCRVLPHSFFFYALLETRRGFSIIRKGNKKIFDFVLFNIFMLRQNFDEFSKFCL